LRLTETQPALADAADVLSDQLRVHIERLSRLLKPHAAGLDGRFRAWLRARRYHPMQIKALIDITPGAAARVFGAEHTPADFFEQVEYSGRRLAKLNVPPTGILRALREYERLLDPVLARSHPREYKNLLWAREQLQFCIVLTLNNAYYQVREQETQAFYELSRAEMHAGTLDDLLLRFLESLKRFCHAADGRLMLLNGSGAGWSPRSRVLGQLAKPRFIARESAAARLILDEDLRTRYPWFWSVPLVSKGRVAGVLQLAFPTSYQWLPRELELLEAALERCLRAAEKARLIEDLARREQQVRELSGHMMQIEEEERRRISRELHDEAGQSLLCVRLKLEVLEKTAAPELRRGLVEARELTEHTIAEIRRVIAALSPAVLEQLGLAAALRQMTNRFREVYPGRLSLHLPRRFRFISREAEIIMFRLVQECFHNIAKHAEASTVNLSLKATDGLLRLNVEDNGVGFELKTALSKQNSFGLAGMRERVALHGGKFDIVSRLNRGTKILVELPIARAYRKGPAGKATGSV